MASAVSTPFRVALMFVDLRVTSDAVLLIHSQDVEPMDVDLSVSELSQAIAQELLQVNCVSVLL